MRVLLYIEIYPTKIPKFEKMKACPEADDFRSAEVKIPPLAPLNEVQNRYWAGNDFKAMHQRYTERFADKIKTYAEHGVQYGFL